MICFSINFHSGRRVNNLSKNVESGEKMRYSLFVYLLNMLNSLQEAAAYIQSNQNSNVCYQLIKNCNQLLKAVETTLQSNEESVKDQRIFNLLTHCEEESTSLLDKILVSTSYQEKVTEFVQSIAKLKRLYRDGINVIYRIVFFAELGQKWDSMSSVYEAFKNRSDCDVAVVLAPIYRAVKINGAVKTDVIYEDYLTPIGIRHIPYQQYDIVKDNPDLVFISNPYEGVTPQQFWPETIAKHARLVYLPYYTDMEMPEKSIYTHCCLPVAQNAWRIIAQSQKIKDMHEKYAPKRGKNVLVTGLPKWDNIFELRKKPDNLPADWEKNLKGKTVFLWNSHFSIDSSGFSTLLENGQAIIDLFTENKDIALIWRPHPMTETVIKLYFPQYLSFWKTLKKSVEKSDNMVIDKNVSYTPAFQCSDALITDLSSFMAQYMLTEKPILWLKRAHGVANKNVSERLVRIECLEQATTSESISDFIANIVQGIDLKKDERLKSMQEDMPSADGHIGERVCNLLLEELKRADENLGYN